MLSAIHFRSSCGVANSTISGHGGRQSFFAWRLLSMPGRRARRLGNDLASGFLEYRCNASDVQVFK